MNYSEIYFLNYFIRKIIKTLLRIPVFYFLNWMTYNINLAFGATLIIYYLGFVNPIYFLFKIISSWCIVNKFTFLQRQQI